MKIFIACWFALGLAEALQGQALARPPIVGLAHVSLLAHDFEASRTFYRDLLGFQEPYGLKNSDGSPSMTFFKVNDRQFIELAPEKMPGTVRLSHFALEVADAEAMRRYLVSQGVAAPDHVPTGRIGNLNFMIKDPEGVNVEIVQYGPASWTRQATGKYMPEGRVSGRLMHVGFTVANLEAELKFYTGVLGFREFWRGSKDGVTLSWINLRLPDSEDYIELMLYGELPAVTERGGANHLCLETRSVDAALSDVQKRAPGAHYTRSMEEHVGKNGKRQLNLFDPDGTRTELMEAKTVSGKAAPSSSAPHPVIGHH